MEKENLKELILIQKENINKIEKIINVETSRDITKENINLNEELIKLKEDNKKLSKKLKEFEEENSILKMSVTNVFNNDKKELLQSSKNNLNVEIENTKSKNLFYLKETENKFKRKINNLKETVNTNNRINKNEFFEELTQTEAKLYAKINENKNKIEEDANILINEINEEYNKKIDEPIPVKVIEEQIKKRNLEFKIGGKFANLVGIFFIIVAILLSAKYTYTTFFKSDVLKSCLFYFIGIAFIGFGEFLNKHKKNYFSLGITSGGIGILFLTTCIVYFYFGIINSIVAIILCILISALAFMLSIKHNKELISVFAIIGGYLPILFLFENQNLFYHVIVYFLILNVFATLISYEKNWVFLKYYTVLLNFLSLFIIFAINRRAQPFQFKIGVTLISLLFYIIITLITSIRKKENLGVPTTVLVGLSSFLSTSLTYFLLNQYNLTKYNAVFSIGFFIFYYLIATYLRLITQDNITTSLFYLISLTFAILTVPFHFSVNNITISWLVMGIVIVNYGLIRNINRFKVGGYILLGLCGISFIFNDINLIGSRSFNEFVIKYTLITFSYTLTLFMVSIYSNKSFYGKNSAIFNFLKGLIILNYLIYIPVTVEQIFSLLNISDYSSFVCIILLSLYAFILPKIKKIYSGIVNVYTSIILTILFIFLLAINSGENLLDINYKIIMSRLLWLICSNLVFAFAVVYSYLKSNKFNKNYVSLIKSIMFLMLVILFLNNNMNDNSIFNSLVFIIAAIINVIYGFYNNNKIIRKFGLVLVIGAIIKLFFIDLIWLNTFQKIISYFVFGFILIGISYFYERLRKKFNIDLDQSKKNKE